MRKARKILLILLGIITISLVYVASVNAQKVQYPIAQLGNCRDAQECFYFCEIPHNNPACWSYGKFILHKDVLGETTKSPDEIAKEHNITFPIPELGNCSSPQACMAFCNDAANQQACTDFGKKKGMVQDNGNQQVDENKILSDAKTQLGCNSKESCIAFCNDASHREQCQQFAKSEGLQHQTEENMPRPSIPPTVFEATKQELGCDSEKTCIAYCNNPDHFQKCQQFAQKHNLIQEQNQQTNQSQTAPSNMPTPPCFDQASCMEWCKNNPGKCNVNQQNNQNRELNQNQMPSQPISPYPSYQPMSGTPPPYQENYQQQSPTSHSTGCTTDQECNQYCQLHPSECPGFQQNPSQQPSVSPQPNNPLSSQPMQQTQQQGQTQPPQNFQSSTDNQQTMCSQTPGCTWTGSTCSCSSGHY